MSVDAAAGGALMNKNYTEAYALIEDMAQNHYQWTNERAITASTPSKKEAGIYEVSDYDHLAAKVDALTQKFEKLNVNAVTPSPTSPPCEICGIFDHIGVDCQLGSATNIIEQLNYAQYNQGTRPNQNFYKNPQGSYGQVAPPGYTNNQGVAQKSSLEILLENCMMNQNKQLQELKNQTGFLNDYLSKHTTKVDSIATHTKMLETQISQVAQQVATSSQTPGVFPGQTETNPKVHVNAISCGGSKLEETVAKAKSVKGESVKLLVFKRHFSKKKAIEHNETITLTRERSAIIKKPPPKLRDPGSFAIPCMIVSETLNRALCDLGASVSLLPLPLFKRMGIGELKPTETTLKLADRSDIQSVGYVEDIPVKIEGIYIPNFHGA
ncbi:hypothetical protein MTR_0075s0050 [Medicago truncatula]|uniref:Uncharacterized protein n=1 Tax=Medicago truncatula TaxID=3880 RepID=A0A072TH64_MEDTR|nr:hypothetical protein MTR_0075s0050 [Medicago truncatula]